MPGEKWKDVPGLEGYFMVSSFGRIKRLEYELQYSDGRIYQKEPLIMKPTLIKALNRFTGDHTFLLRITLTAEKRVYHFSIPRLVYYCFKKKFDRDNEGLLVVCKDMDGRNITLSNLELLTSQERQTRIINAGRHENILLREEVRQKANAALRQKLGVRISNYDALGRRIQTFPAVPAAAEVTGLSISSISSVIRGRKVTAGGFYWRYGAKEKIDIEGFLKRRRAAYKTFHKRQVTQYSLDGKRIAVYVSIEEAGRITGVIATDIGRVINGKRKSAGGFFWQNGKGKAVINMHNYLHGVDARVALKRKKVNQYSLDGKLLNTYNSMSEAAASLGLSPGGLTAACKGTQKTFAGFKWAYI